MHLRALQGALAGAALGLLAGCGGSATGVRAASPLLAASVPAAPLRATAAERGLTFGVAAQQRDLESDAQFAAQVAEQAGVLVPENELKWETVEPQPGGFNFAPGDWLQGFAAEHRMQFRGHTLVWHRQLPPWAGVGDAETVRRQLASHIAAVAGHYAGRVHSWDVVNEAVDPQDGRADGLRNTVWLQALGPEYIEQAFRAAAAADPTAVLVYNDFGVEYDGAGYDARRAAIVGLLARLKSAGVPVHALGIQAHLDAAGSGKFSAAKFGAFLDAVSALGLKIFITELDVSDAGLPGEIAGRDAKVAQAYQQFLEVALRRAAVTTVITWGLSDRYTWLSRWGARADGRAVRPLPLDSSLAPKPAWSALSAAFEAAAR